MGKTGFNLYSSTAAAVQGDALVPAGRGALLEGRGAAQLVIAGADCRELGVGGGSGADCALEVVAGGANGELGLTAAADDGTASAASAAASAASAAAAAAASAASADAAASAGRLLSVHDHASGAALRPARLSSPARACPRSQGSQRRGVAVQVAKRANFEANFSLDRLKA
jgi:hypothetical protein